MTVDLATRRALQVRPPRRAVMYQRWRDLLFAHWRVPAELVQASLPRGLTVDLHDGDAWIGIVPFRMCGVRPAWLPAVPGLSDFLELNLRTYAFDESGVPGVWFYSLDANNAVAVALARRFFHLPYFRATMCATEPAEGVVRFESRRRAASGVAALRYEYRPRPESPAPAEPGTLDFFLVERYVLFAHVRERILRGRVWHTPYRIGDARLAACDDGLFALDDLPAPGRPPDHVVASPGVDVTVFALETVRG